MKLMIRKIEQNEVEEFDRKAEDFGSIFTMSWFTSLNPQTFQIGIFNENGLVGGFAITTKKQFGKKIFKDPLFTPNCGLFIIDNSRQSTSTQFTRKITSQLAEYLSHIKTSIVLLHFPPEITDLQPFIWKNFNVRPSFTYRIYLSNLSMKEIEEMSFCSKDIRRKIVKAAQKGIEVSESPCNDESIAPFLKSFMRSKIGTTKATLQSYIEVAVQNQKGKLLVAKENNIVVASVFITYSKDVSYLMLVGHMNGYSNEQALLIHRVILDTKKSGRRIFDFEGSMNMSVEKYFRQFGGQIVLFSSVLRSPFIFETTIRRLQVKSYRK